MRVVFLAADDEFAGAMQKALYDRYAEWIVGSVISTVAIYKKNALEAGLFVVKHSGVRYMAAMIRMKILRKLVRARKTVVPSHLAVDHNVPIHRSKNINSQESLEQLAAWHPDIIISTNFCHYIGKKARESANLGTWNLHKSYLPHYRGMAPSFFALLEGAEYSGATLHVVAKGFDTGDIIAQVKVPISKEDTVYSLNRRSSIEGGRMLAKLADETGFVNVRTAPQSEGDWPQHTYPNRDEVRLFRKGRHKF